MSQWFFHGEIFYDKNYNTIVEKFLEKFKRIGLNDNEIEKMLDDVSIFENGIPDLICTRAPSKIYVDGFYFIDTKETIQIILSGIFNNENI